MTVREARFQDIPAIFKLGQQALAESRFSDVCKADEVEAKGLLYELISDGGTKFKVLVADDISGCIIGSVSNFYEVLSLPVLNDHFWYCRPGASPRLAFRLLEALHAWADSKGPMLKRHIVNDAIVDVERSRKILERRGYRVAGYVFEKEPSK